jgi:histidyl-tRNA synthetase
MTTTIKKKKASGYGVKPPEPKSLEQKQGPKYWTCSTATVVPEMALYYGFSPLLNLPRLEKNDESVLTALEDRYGELFNVKTKVALLRQHFARNPGAGPFAFISENRQPSRSKLWNTRGGSSDEPAIAEYHLDILGTARPTAEALLMKLCYEIARECWDGDVVLDINSVGERESFSRFSRDIGNHFRKQLENLEPDCRQGFKKSAFAPLFCRHDLCQKARQEMPESLGFLSEPSRGHFMSVLEHLEAAGLPYTTDKELIVEPDIVQHTIFRISILPEATATKAEGDPAKDTLMSVRPNIVARGSRWGGLAKKMGFKKDVLGASAVVRAPIRTGKNNKNTKEKMAQMNAQKKITAPSFYFVHIGDDALRKSLELIEYLRRARISVYHALLKDKLASQLGTAENMHIPYVLIMGQKESVDGTIIVRELSTRSQETVPLSRLTEHLKKLV